MTQEFRDHLDAVRRTVSAEPGADGTIATAATISRAYATGVDDLWEACTTPDRLARWFAPVSGDLRLGGRFQVQGNAGGTVETCDPPHGFTATWEFGGETSRIEVRIEPEGADRARMTLTHVADLQRGRWDEYGPGAVGVGWDLAFVGLAWYVSEGGETPLESTGWGESEGAKAFMAASSRHWADASVAAGTPEADARAAEERTSAFYTGAG